MTFLLGVLAWALALAAVTLSTRRVTWLPVVLALGAGALLVEARAAWWQVVIVAATVIPAGRRIHRLRSEEPAAAEPAVLSSAA